MNKNNEIWNNILNALKKKLDENTLNTYLKDVSLSNLDENNKTFILTANDEFILGSIKTSLKTYIENAFYLVTKENYTLENVILEKVMHEQISDKFMKDSVFSGDNLIHNYTFANYYETFANTSALLQAKELVNSFSDNSFPFFPIFIHGTSGVGKTHLVNAIGNEVKMKYPQMNIKYLTSKEFLNLYVDALHNSSNEIKQMSNFFENLDLLILDDFQFLANKKKTEEQFFYIFESLQRRGAKMVLTSDVSPNNLIGIESRLLTRLESGIFIEILNPDYESRLKLVENKIKEFKNVTFEKGVSEIIAQVNVLNVRSLEGKIKTLVARSITESRTPGNLISCSFAEEILKVKATKKVQQQDLTHKKIINACCIYYHISVEDLLSTKRNQDISLARNMAIYLIRDLLGLTYKDIASIFNRKDHTTIISSCKRIKKLNDDGDVSTDIQELKRKII